MVERFVFPSRERWLEHRAHGIGGSEISAVVGLNPYMSNVDLWERKTGAVKAEDISDKPYVQYGVRAEPLMREFFKLDFPQIEMFYEENNSFRNSKYPWALASLDGWLRDKNGRAGVWECKTANILQPRQKDKWNHQIPPNYFCQILFYMAVIEADFTILTARLNAEYEGLPYSQTRNYIIERADVRDDMDYLMEKGAEFWESVQNGQKPALLLPEI